MGVSGAGVLRATMYSDISYIQAHDELRRLLAEADREAAATPSKTIKPTNCKAVGSLVRFQRSTIYLQRHR